MGQTMTWTNPSKRLLLLVAALLWIIPAAQGQGKPAATRQAAPAKAPGKAKAPRREAKKPAAVTAATPGAVPVAAVEHRRDPFQALLTKAKGGLPEHLPPGKAGLVIATLRVDGVVRSANGMIAAVTNPQQRVYFIREGDKLYDGSVEKISLDEVAFKESSKDAFGRPIERTVVKRIYPIAGEEQ
jgi:Tfp pilus assembly protein PilP